jgi:hypothetical protein
MASTPGLAPRGSKERAVQFAAAERRAEHRHNTKVFAVTVLCLVLALSSGSWWFYLRTPPTIAVTRQQIAKIELAPIPEGPGAVFARDTSSGAHPLGQVLSKVPIPLPGPLRQGFWCQMGGVVRITLTDGRTISYGPCRLPPAIVTFRSGL